MYQRLLYSYIPLLTTRVAAFMKIKEHWEGIYSTKPVDGVSWFQEKAVSSLELIDNAGVAADAGIIDIGGGASRLVDGLIAAGYRNLTVLDIAAAALARSQHRLGPVADRINWLTTDVTCANLPSQAFDVWHDRAVFHFLTDVHARRAYLACLANALAPRGHVIMATFSAAGGPLTCSGLPVVRYSPQLLLNELGPGYELIAHRRECHPTPFDTTQAFIYCHFRKRESAAQGSLRATTY